MHLFPTEFRTSGSEGIAVCDEEIVPWYFGSDTLVETLAFRAAAFDALVFVSGEAATDHGVFSSDELAK